MVLSKYVLSYIFRKIAKLPELVLVASLGGGASSSAPGQFFGLSLEMGALIAGVAISTFPTTSISSAKIVSIRDFFITLFFVALGMEIPNPLDNLGMFLVAGAAALFLIASRFLSVYPILYLLKNGNRVSLLTSINLSQLSEFALVITAIGLKSQHIVPDIQAIIIFVFVITSISSTYMIKYNQQLQGVLGKIAARVGFKDLESPLADEPAEAPKDIALLGFFRVASAFIREIEDVAVNLKDKIVVVDFNPRVLRRLPRHGIKVVYGDISNPETLHHAGIGEAKIVISTISDEILVGTDNSGSSAGLRRSPAPGSSLPPKTRPGPWISITPALIMSTCPTSWRPSICSLWWSACSGETRSSSRKRKWRDSWSTMK
jgi:hypothetical protein